MSRRESFLLCSRVLAVIFMVWTLAEISYLPEKIYSLLHYVGEPFSSYRDYVRHFDLLSVGFLVARIVGYGLLSLWFYKAGPEVQDLLLPANESEAIQS